MIGLTSPDSVLLEQRSKAVPAWFRFCGVSLLLFYCAMFVWISLNAFGDFSSRYVTFTSANPAQVLLIVWAFFLLMAVSFYGLVKGYYLGLLACLLLGYSGMVGILYSTLTTGMVDLTLIVYLLVVYQLHKIVGRWRRLKKELQLNLQQTI
ncbi:MAG: hypothetical protein LAT66_08110 [Alkalimonas sp.]|nr:hypothetical protein [Alkalimonas sp.]